METRKPDQTYLIGKTRVHVFSPGPISEEEKKRILTEYHRAGWAIINELLERGESEEE